MEPRAFGGQTSLAADNQPEYLLLPVRQTGDGVTHSCWQLTDAELEIVLRTQRVWVSQLTGGGPIQPLKLSAERPFDHSGGAGS
jgi:hypothetical protein